MPSVSEQVVRDWLEGLGFLVRQPRKYQVVARAKRPDEEIDLLAWNPAAPATPPPPGVWDGAAMRQVRAAAIGIRSWLTERFTPSTFEEAPELLRIGAPDVRREASRRLGGVEVVSVLCLPELPATPDLRKRTLELLARNGITGVVLLRTILGELAASAARHLDYDRSDVLQLTRAFKSLGLLRDPQMELFRVRSGRRPVGGRSKRASPPDPARRGGSEAGPAAQADAP